MSLSVPQQRLQEWAKAQVSVLAGYPDDGQIATYLISLSSKQELGDYAKVSTLSANALQTALPAAVAQSRSLTRLLARYSVL